MTTTVRPGHDPTITELRCTGADRDELGGGALPCSRQAAVRCHGCGAALCLTHGMQGLGACRGCWKGAGR